MAIRLLSLVMMAASGIAAMAKAQEIYNESAMRPVLHALDARGIAYKRTILMAIATPANEADAKSV